MKKRIAIFMLAIFIAVTAFSGISTNAKAETNPFYDSDQAYKEELKNVLGTSAAQSSKTQETPQEEIQAESVSRERYIVKFHKDVPLEQISGLIKELDYKVIGESKNRTFAVTVSDLDVFKQAIAGLTEYLEEDIQMQLFDAANSKQEPLKENQSTSSFTPNDPLYASQWYLPDIHVPEVWDYNRGASYTYVAIIDSGIDRSQPDLKYADIRRGWDLINETACLYDYNGHGTNVAGIIAAPLNNGIGVSGISPYAAIVPFRVSDSTGRAYVSDIAQALRYAADASCQVVNISMGTTTETSVLDEAVSYAYGKGCIVVAAAGNDGTNVKGYPASCAGAISVGSVNESNVKSDFSNYNESVDAVAPGEQMLTTDDSAYTGADYSRHNGTSFSAPCVAALAALSVSYDADITPSEFETYLKATCTDLGTAGYDTSYGNGLVNADALLSMLYYVDADLNNVAVSNGTFSPTFSPYVTQYTLTLPWDNGSLTIAPEPVNDSATFKIDGQQTGQMSYTLNNGESRTITIDVTSASNTVSKQYVIHATRSDIPVYTVYFNSQGGTGVGAVSAQMNSTIAEPGQPSRQGYVFGGWFKESGCYNAWNFTSDRVTGNTTLFAKWTVRTACTIWFDSQGGSGVAPKVTKYNTATKAPRSPVRYGYTFKGWYREPACVSAWNFRTKLTTDITLYARWAPNTYKVTFKTQGGRSVPAKKALYDTPVSMPATPTRTGYTFGGWYKESACVNAWDFANDKVMGNTNIYAKWIINIYSISFDSRGGTPVASTTAPYNTRVPAPATPSMTGYTFKGWYRDPACRRSWNIRSGKVTSDMTLYAKWAVNIYKVTFNTQGSKAVAAKKAAYNSLVALPKTPARVGYTFGGWFTEPDCINAWNFGSDRITDNRTLYAKWTINTYAVAFNSMGGTPVEAAAVQYGSTVIVPTAPTRDGFTFAGWYSDPGCRRAWNFAVKVTANVTLYAKWV